ncbi:MAG: hypothetical protein MUE53_03710 [Chitinophagales bacterium]|jgi:hypothetical protein|nr:hypothetical protein [Chitinophagales bacterium]
MSTATFNSYQILKSYNVQENKNFELLTVLVYQRTVIMVGYEKKNQPFSSLLHIGFDRLLSTEYQYSLQLQLIEDEIPQSFRNCPEVKIYHCESPTMYIPVDELEKLNPYKSFSKTFPNANEKIMKQDLKSFGWVEFYHYPYRVYNDLRNLFPSAVFHSLQLNSLPKLAKFSNGENMTYFSLKTNYLSCMHFENNTLKTIQFLPYEKEGYISKLQEFVSTNQISGSSKIIYSAVSAQHKDNLDLSIKNHFPNANNLLTQQFKMDENFWLNYSDTILCL